MKKYTSFSIVVFFILTACQAPQPKERSLSEKHNYIILLDLSDRLIVQPDQPERDQEIIASIYGLFENKVRKELYIKSRDEIKVVIAPQRGSGLPGYIYEEELYVNMETIPNIYRRPKEEERRDSFRIALSELYSMAAFSKKPEDYYGADIWRYFYEDLKQDYSGDSLTKNFLFILTDGYPIVGKNVAKLQPVKERFEDLRIVLVEISPRDKDMEWDRIRELWTAWFDSMGIKNYSFIKRKAISKEIEEISDIITQ